VVVPVRPGRTVLSAAFGFALGVIAGSIPFAWLLHRLATGRDLRSEGSGNPGATNLLRAAGRFWGAAGFALDAGKGAAAVLLAALLSGDRAKAAAALGAVVGHVFTPWLSGRGGKGVAPAAGAYAVLAPAATAAALGVFAAVVAITGWISAGSVAGAAALPIAVLFFGPGGGALPAAIAIAALVAWRHRANFARMRSGAEPRVGRGGDSS
jgi:glycerol-3-phosphate acyltransferase PlsY